LSAQQPETLAKQSTTDYHATSTGLLSSQ